MTNQQATTDPAVDGRGDGANGLAQEFEQRGLTLQPTAELPVVSGPLSAVGFAPAGGDDGRSVIAAAVSAENDHELFDLAVAAIQAAHLDLTPATAVSIETPSELAATVQEPHQLFAVFRADAQIGLVIRQLDRRGGGAGTALAGQAAATSPASMSAPTPTVAAAGSALGSLGLLQDVILEVTVELGRTRMPLARLMNLGVGSVVELDRSAGAPVDVRVNGTLFAKGEVVVVDDEYAVRILEILAPPGG